VCKVFFEELYTLPVSVERRKKSIRESITAAMWDICIAAVIHRLEKAANV